MRAKLTFAAAALASATAFAAPSVSFNTVFDSSATFDNGGVLLGTSQVVVGTGGDVFTNAFLDNGDSVIIYSNPTGPNTWNSSAVVGPNTAVAGLGPNPDLIVLDNLSLASNASGDKQLFFAAGNANSQYGVLQLDVTPSGSTVSDVAFDGDGGPYSFNGANSVINPDGTISLQVDASGKALFPANTSAHAGVLVQGNAGGITQVFTPTPTLGLSLSINRLGIGNESPAPTSLAQLTASPGGQGVYVISGGSPVNISGSLAPAQSGASMIMGYTSNASVDAALMLGQGTGGSTTQQVVLSKNNGAPVSILAGGDTSITPAAGVSALGELSPQGKIAVYVPDGTNDNADTIQYADASLASPVGTVVAAVDTDATAPAAAKVALSNGVPLPIVGLQFGGSSWVPQINNGGTMIFNAEVFDASLNSDEQALLEWDPSKLGSSPVVLLETGQPADLGGSPSSSVVDGYVFNAMTQENDFYKNAISDDNFISVGVNYDDASNAVIITQLNLTTVPEPATLGLVSVAGMGLLARRRRV